MILLKQENLFRDTKQDQCRRKSCWSGIRTGRCNGSARRTHLGLRLQSQHITSEQSRGHNRSRILPLSCNCKTGVMPQMTTWRENATWNPESPLCFLFSTALLHPTEFQCYCNRHALLHFKLQICALLELKQRKHWVAAGPAIGLIDDKFTKATREQLSRKRNAHLLQK